MTRILTLVALLLCAILAHAQTNTATISQTGVSQAASTTQTGSSLVSSISQIGTPSSNTGNVGITVQSGTGHLATVTQNTGARDNSAIITQANTTGTGSNTATVSQNSGGGLGLRSNDPAAAGTGNGNWAGITQYGSENNARVRQNNAVAVKNYAEIWQNGNTNEADIQQTRGIDNRAEIFQGNEQRSGGQTVGILPTVDVSGNFADIDQERASRNDAFIRQFSNDNRAEVNQNSQTSTDNIASIQQGDGTAVSRAISNSATIEQNNTSQSNQAYIVQLGTRNEAEINQDGVDDSGGASTNTASVTQTADASDNVARIDQSSKTILSSRNTAIVSQAGSDGTAHIRQTKGSEDNRAAIRQGTSSNTDQAYIRQSASFSSTASISQNLTATSGTSNIASVEQGIDLITSARSMSAVIGQEGSRNSARLLQLGTASSATVIQSGNNNVLTGPAAGIAPSSGEGTLLGGAYAIQNGTNHRLILSQTSPGSENTTIFNIADVEQLGTGNVLVGSQIAETTGNYMTVCQSGNQNQTFIQQNGTGLTP